MKKKTKSSALIKTFNAYVKAVQKADLKAMFDTVTKKKKLHFLTACGNVIKSRRGYYEFHRKWFKEKLWKMPVNIIAFHEGEEMGYVIAEFHYKKRLDAGGWYILDSNFTLIFQKEGGKWKVVADICTPIKRLYTEKNPAITYSREQLYALDMLEARRTVHQFKRTPVPREHIMKIIDAARFAPTAGNQQPWKFLVIEDRKRLGVLKKKVAAWYSAPYKGDVRNKKELEEVQRTLRKMLGHVFSAPVYIAVLVDMQVKYPYSTIYDGTLAAANLMIAARTLGYGSGFFTTFFPEDQVRELFHIPRRYKLICFSPIGIPKHWPEAPKKKDLKQLVVMEKF
ncbi:MAG: nitroreductase family protein [candidate division WOR-3 bacterium]|nr:MAG: nitroreductase family protein [candidate division WOR-3 bacterium]